MALVIVATYDGDRRYLARKPGEAGTTVDNFFSRDPTEALTFACTWEAIDTFEDLIENVLRDRWALEAIFGEVEADKALQLSIEEPMPGEAAVYRVRIWEWWRT